MSETWKLKHEPQILTIHEMSLQNLIWTVRLMSSVTEPAISLMACTLNSSNDFQACNRSEADAVLIAEETYHMHVATISCRKHALRHIRLTQAIKQNQHVQVPVGGCPASVRLPGPFRKPLVKPQDLDRISNYTVQAQYMQYTSSNTYARQLVCHKVTAAGPRTAQNLEVKQVWLKDRSYEID